MFPVPQVLRMMVELEEDPDWAVADEIEDEDNDRCGKILSCFFLVT